VSRAGSTAAAAELADAAAPPADAFEARVAQLQDYESSDLPERTKAALRLADAISLAPEIVDEDFYRRLREHFSDDEILDLGMSVAFFSGWQRFIEAFKIVPDRWADGDPLPWMAPPRTTDPADPQPDPIPQEPS
jgi:alkylhydroperoxidase family enzyme